MNIEAILVTLNILREEYDQLFALKRQLDEYLTASPSHLNLNIPNNALQTDQISDYLLREMNKKIEEIEQILAVAGGKSAKTNLEDSCVASGSSKLKTTRKRKRNKNNNDNALGNPARQKKLQVLREMKRFNLIVKRKPNDF